MEDDIIIASKQIISTANHVGQLWIGWMQNDIS
jgi:hypothetical protein